MADDPTPRKASEIFAGFLEVLLDHWKLELPVGRGKRYFVAWLGAFHFCLPALLMNAQRLSELYPDLITSATIAGGLAVMVYPLLPMALVAPSTKRQTTVRIFLASFMFCALTWGIIMRFAPQNGGGQ